MAAFRYDNSINNAGLGQACQGVLIYVLTQPANTITLTPLASLFSDSSGTVPLANPVTSDGNGNYFFYVASGTYTLVYVDPFGRIPTEIFPDQAVTTQGGGTVTSIGLTVPAEFSVAGSPVTVSGTLAVTKATQSANKVYAGPSSGGVAQPTFRSLVAADLPGGVGTVSSVTLAVSANALFTASVTGTNPITSSGTFTLNLAFTNQAANTVLAGPASGGSGAISARALVAADIFGNVAVTFSATPTFNASLFASPTFKITLTGDVTSSTISNAKAGQVITFIITQDGTGSHAFAWPATTKGASNIGADANSVSVQSFVYDGTSWRATGPGSVNAS